MKIKTITTWADYNYGASLQAYALLNFLKERGHDVELIKYLPSYQTRMYDYIWVNPESKASRYVFTRWLYRIAKFCQRMTTLGRKKIFDKFNFEILKTTNQTYYSFEDLENEPPKADLYIVGSDQVWNVLYDAGKDPAFFLDFVRQGKKASYAASFSFLDIDDVNKQRISKYLKSFDGVSVREYQGRDLLLSMGINAEWVLDPVFLLSLDDWNNLRKNALNFEYKEPYLLIYDFEGNPYLKRFAQIYAKSNNLKVYAITDKYSVRYADKNFNKAGPLEFVNMIANCSAFVSNSFHGTAFSIMFHKPFFVFNRFRHNVNSRMESLLTLFDLKDCMVSEKNPIDLYVQMKFDWNKVDCIKQEKIRDSVTYLKKLGI